MGGDARIACEPASGVNRYGCPPRPQPGVLAYGSSTASPIASAGFAAAEALHRRLGYADSIPSARTNPTREFDRVRAELAGLCGVAHQPETGIVFAASGTDIHLIVAQLAASGRLAGGGAAAPMLVVMTEATETGNGVPAALSGRHHNERAALVGAVHANEFLAGLTPTAIAEVPSRTLEGFPISAAAIDAQVEALVSRAVGAGQRVLLIVGDVSKTGLLAPTPACALKLLHRFSTGVDVLIDACQFRLVPATLCAYLDCGFLVALTGSKFVTGPAFSGALLIPASLARKWRDCPLPAALAAYSARADWPQGWAARESLPQAANLGLLLRWEAALAAMKEFSLLAGANVATFLRTFASAVQARLARDPSFESLAAPPLDRSPVAGGGTWDHIPTIFPFLLRRPDFLSPEATGMVYKALLARHIQIGQPVPCGRRQERPVSALRLCTSMRLAVDALSPQGRGTNIVIAETLAVLDQTAQLARKPDVL
ncbi:MAG: hypothetical protein WCG85_08180 [Polyangia bacterium]